MSTFVPGWVLGGKIFGKLFYRDFPAFGGIVVIFHF
jgi:hypothetical protein